MLAGALVPLGFDQERVRARRRVGRPVSFDGGLSWAELDRASDALAALLASRGFVPGDRCALYVQNDPAFVIGLVAAWKVGGAPPAISPVSAAGVER